MDNQDKDQPREDIRKEIIKAYKNKEYKTLQFYIGMSLKDKWEQIIKTANNRSTK